MTKQLDAWEGEFGVAYTDQTELRDWRVRLPAFRQMLNGLTIQSALEVGCNRGHNLLTLVEVLGKGTEVVGVEPNEYTVELAKESGVRALKGNVFNLEFEDSRFDLVFTAGVLIHIALDDLPTAISEIYRVSKRYILAAEYFDENETQIHFLGRDDLLWKRDFLGHYQAQFPDLNLVQSGYWEKEYGFIRTNWWLLEKHK